MANKVEVTIDIIAHATEDISKILEPISKLLGVDEKKFSRQHLTGHFENPITMLRAKMKKKEAKNFVEKLVSNIAKEEMDELIADIENRIQDSTLYLRVSKQDLIKGSLVLKEKDAVKLKIFSPAYNKNRIVKNYVELLKGSN